MHPYISSQLAAEHRREMLEHAEQQRLTCRLIALARASRRAGRSERRMRRAAREARQLRAKLEQ